MKPRKQLVCRRDFMRKLCQSGLTYRQASQAYTVMMALIEESILNGDRIKLGQIGSLTPVVKPPRTIVMGVKRGPGGEYIPSRRVFHVDERVDYRFNFFKEFARTHQVR